MYNYVLLPQVGRLAPGIITLPRKMQGIRNDDDQSLSPVTTLVSLLFLSFLDVQEHTSFLDF